MDVPFLSSHRARSRSSAFDPSCHAPLFDETALCLLWKNPITIIFLVLLLSISQPSVSQQPPKASIRDVQDAIRLKEYDRALQIAQSALIRTPKDFALLTLKGVVLEQKGSPIDALNAFHRALAVSPNYLPALEGEAQIEYQLGDRRAKKVLTQIVRANPQNETAHAMLGVIAEQESDCATAVDQFQLGGQSVSSSAGSLGIYGFCLEKLDRPKDAVSIFQQLLALVPDQASARYDLAVVQLKAGDGNSAIQTLEPLLVSNSSSEVLSLAADASEAGGNTTRAVDLLRRAIIQEPTNINYYLDFAGLSFDHASYQTGVDVLDAGIKRLPENSSLYIARGLLNVQLGKNDSADADFKTAEQLDPARGVGAYTQSLLESEKGNPDAALAKVRTRLGRYPDDAQLHFLLANILERRGAAVGTPEFEEALQHARRSVDLDPSLTYSRNLLATLYLDEGMNGQAIEQCRAVIKLDPTDQTALYHLIMALRKTGQAGEIPHLVEELSNVRRENQKVSDYKKRFQIVEHSPEQNK